MEFTPIDIGKILVAAIGGVATIFGVVYKPYQKMKAEERRKAEEKKLADISKNNEDFKKLIRIQIKTNPLLKHFRSQMKASQILLYGIHNGDNLPNNFSLKKVTCLDEDYDENDLNVKSQKEEIKNTPIAAFGEFMTKYLDGKMFICEDSEKSDSDFIKFAKKQYGLTATFSTLVNDLYGLPLGVLVVNYHYGPEELTKDRIDIIERTATGIGVLFSVNE